MYQSFSEKKIQNCQLASLKNKGNNNMRGAHMRGHIRREIRYSTTSKMRTISMTMENAEVSLHAIVLQFCFILVVL